MYLPNLMVFLQCIVLIITYCIDLEPIVALLAFHLGKKIEEISSHFEPLSVDHYLICWRRRSPHIGNSRVLTDERLAIEARLNLGACGKYLEQSYVISLEIKSEISLDTA